jgi:hypothetical protein
MADTESQHTAVHPAVSRSTIDPSNGAPAGPAGGRGYGEKTKAADSPTADGVGEKAEVLGVDEDQAIDGVDPVYAAKARVLNRAVQEIGMGRYQWQLFGVIGFGWAMDNMVRWRRACGCKERRSGGVWTGDLVDVV